MFFFVCGGCSFTSPRARVYCTNNERSSWYRVVIPYIGWTNPMTVQYPLASPIMQGHLLHLIRVPHQHHLPIFIRISLISTAIGLLSCQSMLSQTLVFRVCS